MKHLLVTAVLSLLFVLVPCFTATGGDLVGRIDPFIGTGGHGHTYPGATVPFGMVQLSPDNGREGWDWCSGYNYSDSMIVGFSHTHLSGTGCADLGDISLMPALSAKVAEDSFRSRFSHAQEFAEPGYYRVHLSDDKIAVELTATTRAGFHRYTFPVTDSARVLINLQRGQEDTPVDTYVKVVNATLVLGYRFSRGWAADQRVFFAARLSKPMESFLLYKGEHPVAGAPEARGKDVKAMLLYNHADPAHPLLVKVGISSVSAENALKNLDTEIAGWDFHAVRNAAHRAWERALDRVRIRCADDNVKQVFATALYHAFLAPTVFSDVDGRYRGADGRIHVAEGHPYYSTYSLWDTYRAAHPLYTLMAPDRVDGFVTSMLAFQHESGYLPVWQLAANETNTMVGYHAVPVIADAYLKGFRGFDAKDALAAMKKSALRDHRGLKYYSTAIPALYANPLRELERTAFDRKGIVRSRVLAGYTRSLAGDTIDYHSSRPGISQALITRTALGKNKIAWETDPVPSPIPDEGVSFVWLAGISAERGGHRFTLLINGDSVATFAAAKDTTETEKTWSVEGKNGVRLTFCTGSIDLLGDHFGNMILTVPATMCKAGSPLVVGIRGEGTNSPDWAMTFLSRLTDQCKLLNEFGMAHDAGGDVQFVRVDIDHVGPPVRMSFALDGGEKNSVTIVPGYTPVYLPLPVVKVPQTVHVTIGGEGASLWSDTLTVMPVRLYGYVPADEERESVSKALEYAIDDFCIGQMAQAMGEKEDAALFAMRGMYYRKLFDSTSGFFRGKKTDGSWVSPFNPRFSTEKQPEYTEGNAWQYLWLVPHDIAGLTALVGGREKFDLRLDSLFSQSSDITDTGAPPDESGLIGLYAHGNEPSHHIGYLYDYDGKPWKTQALVHKIMTDFYKTGPEGLCGNEDCGQMSAWYVFSAMGFYPVTPAGGVYALGSPVLEEAQIDVGAGKTFTMHARGLTPANMFIQSGTLNGRPLKGPWITHDEMMKGGTLDLTMGAAPNRAWGSDPSAVPPAMPPK